MVRALRSVLTVVDRVSSRVLGVDGAARNVGDQLVDRRVELARVVELERRLAAHATGSDARAA